MEIIGAGFLAYSLRPIAGRHGDVAVLAAGVSSSTVVSPDAFLREARLLYDVLHSCADTGRRLVFFSTATAGMYSGTAGPGREDGPVFPSTSYALHKLSLEAVIAASGVDHLILRLAHTVGARQRAHQMLPSLVHQIRSGRVTVYKGACRDLIDVMDVVTITDALLVSGACREVVNIASGVAVPAEDIVEHVEHRLGVRAEKLYVDQPGGHQVSIEKLARLVPSIAAMNFGNAYFRTVIDRHLPVVAGDHRTAFASDRPQRAAG